MFTQRFSSVLVFIGSVTGLSGFGTALAGLLNQSTVAFIGGAITILGGAVVSLYGLIGREKLKTRAAEIEVEALERAETVRDCENRYSKLETKYDLAITQLNEAKTRIAIWESQHPTPQPSTQAPRSQIEST